MQGATNNLPTYFPIKSNKVASSNKRATEQRTNNERTNNERTSSKELTFFNLTNR